MTKTFAARTTPAVLATLLTTAMLLATNALAGHQYRVSAVQQATQVAVLDVQHVTIVGRRSARA